MVSTGYPFIIEDIRLGFEGKRCVPFISVFVHPGTWPILDEYFALRSKVVVAFQMPDVISTHQVMWEDYPELLDEYNLSGYCTAVYGNTTDNLDFADYPVTGYRVVDLEPTLVDDVEYLDGETGWLQVSVGGSVAVFIVAIEIVATILWQVWLKNVVRVDYEEGGFGKLVDGVFGSEELQQKLDLLE